MSAVELRDRGNQLFRDGKTAEAGSSYREALTLQRAKEGPGADIPALGKAIRLNLATCLLRLESDHQEVVALCDEVLAADCTCAKALFKRGVARQALAKGISEGAEAKRVLQAARKDLLQAAKVEPSDRQCRALLDEVTESLRQFQPKSGLLGFGKGLYEDRPIAPPPAAPVVCSACERVGHRLCGKTLWVQQRSQWLGIGEDELNREPDSFEDDGPLQAELSALRSSDRALAQKGPCYEDLSDDECETLRDVLEATDRPYPKLKRKVSLVQAVHCAEELWAESD